MTHSKRDKTYFHFLDMLRATGVTNMFGAPQYLESYFDLSKKEAVDVWKKWIDTQKVSE